MRKVLGKMLSRFFYFFWWLLKGFGLSEPATYFPYNICLISIFSFQVLNAVAEVSSVPFTDTAISTTVALTIEKWGHKKSGVTTPSWSVRRFRKSEPRHIDSCRKLRMLSVGVSNIKTINLQSCWSNSIELCETVSRAKFDKQFWILVNYVPLARVGRFIRVQRMDTVRRCRADMADRQFTYNYSTRVNVWYKSRINFEWWALLLEVDTYCARGF